VDVRFLHYSFFTPEWRAVIAQNTVLGATVDRIPLLRFRDFPLGLPPLENQRQIAAILSSYVTGRLKTSHSGALQNQPVVCDVI
jgi:type I restriction enzyme S subunit